MSVESKSPLETTQQSKTAQQEIDSLFMRAEKIITEDAEQALALVQIIRKHAKETSFSKSQVRNNESRACILEGSIFLEKGAFEQAVPAYLKALEAVNSTAETKLTARALVGLGSSYLAMETYPDALQRLLRALTLYRNCDDLNGQATALIQIGKLELALQKPDKSLAYLEKALEIAQKSGALELQAAALNHLCCAYQFKGKNQQAIQLGLKSAEIYQELGDRIGEAAAYNALGDVSIAIGDLNQALNFLQLTAEVTLQTGKRDAHAQALCKIGSVHFQSGHINLAITYLMQAMEIAYQEGALPVVMDVHKNLSAVYKSTEDYRSALEHFEQYFALQKKIFDIESDRRLKTIEIVNQVETARKNAEIYELRNVELQKEIEEHKKAQLELEHLATHDQLTGLVNRRHFINLVTQAIEQAQRYKRPFSAMMVDIDNFKNINDTFGHSAGDLILVEIASRMRSVLRKADVIGRYGGDEFAIFLPETSTEGARRLSERLRSAVADQAEMVEGVSLPVTVSIGVTSYLTNTDTNINLILQEADKALYISKYTGRNRVTMFEEVLFHEASDEISRSAGVIPGQIEFLSE